MPRDGKEMPEPETVMVRDRAMSEPTTRWTTPGPANIGRSDAPGDDEAIPMSTPKDRTPHVANTNEIGTGETPDRLERATCRAEPSPEPLSPAQTAPTERKARRKRAITGPATTGSAPASEPIDPVSNDGIGGDGQAESATQTSRAIPETEEQIVSTLFDLQQMRKYCIKRVNGSIAATEQMIARRMGYRIDGTAAERKKLFAKASAFRQAVEKSGQGQTGSDTQSPRALAALIPIILADAGTRGPYEKILDDTKKAMIETAAGAQLAPFSETVRGFGALGLAVIMAEAGVPIGQYRTVSGLWKRLGLAVFGGRRQRRVKDKEDAILQGYNPVRRAQVYAFLSDSMFRAQWAGAKLACECHQKPRAFTIDKETGAPVCSDCGQHGEASEIIPAHALGPYGEVYAHRRAATDQRILRTSNLDDKDPDKWTASRCHNDGRRVMSKALIRDLWRVARGLPPRGSNPAEEQ